MARQATPTSEAVRLARELERINAKLRDARGKVRELEAAHRMKSRELRSYIEAAELPMDGAAPEGAP